MQKNQEPICGVNGDVAYLRDGTNRLLADMGLSVKVGSAAPEYHHTHLLTSALRALGLSGDIRCFNSSTEARRVEYEGHYYRITIKPEREP